MTVLIGEPFGRFGAMLPVGHIAIYLDRVCADGPLRLRMCRPGEPAGVVIARYHRIGQTDWIATPIMEFLYATEHPEEIPAYATPELVSALRKQYREQYLSELVPDGRENSKAFSEWLETVGVSYDRRVWGYELATSRAQDEQLVAFLNGRPNKHIYRLRKRNCANFAAGIINFYFPGAIAGADRLADFGVMTPKHVARLVYEYGMTHPETELKAIQIPQVAGSFHRSRPVRNGAEAGLKTKRYLVALSLLQPEALAGLLVLYLEDGRWEIGAGSCVEGPDFFQRSFPQIDPASFASIAKLDAFPFAPEAQAQERELTGLPCLKSMAEPATHCETQDVWYFLSSSK
ncbi:MAG TPA: hypothetical protein VMD98_04675 [Bryocella sp.]|nr:hypothetical protein [Bryocella sp.]